MWPKINKGRASGIETGASFLIGYSSTSQPFYSLSKTIFIKECPDFVSKMIKNADNLHAKMHQIGLI